jgi:hypothetical protein
MRPMLLRRTSLISSPSGGAARALKAKKQTLI